MEGTHLNKYYKSHHSLTPNTSLNQFQCIDDRETQSNPIDNSDIQFLIYITSNY